VTQQGRTGDRRGTCRTQSCTYQASHSEKGTSGRGGVSSRVGGGGVDPGSKSGRSEGAKAEEQGSRGCRRGKEAFGEKSRVAKTTLLNCLGGSSNWDESCIERIKGEKPLSKVAPQDCKKGEKKKPEGEKSGLVDKKRRAGSLFEQSGPSKCRERSWGKRPAEEEGEGGENAS